MVPSYHYITSGPCSWVAVYFVTIILFWTSTSSCHLWPLYCTQSWHLSGTSYPYLICSCIIHTYYVQPFPASITFHIFNNILWRSTVAPIKCSHNPILKIQAPYIIFIKYFSWNCRGFIWYVTEPRNEGLLCAVHVT